MNHPGDNFVDKHRYWPKIASHRNFLSVYIGESWFLNRHPSSLVRPAAHKKATSNEMALFMSSQVE